MTVTLSEGGGVTSKGDMLLTTTTPFSQRAEPSPLWSKASPKRRIAPVMGGPGESSPRSGFEGAGAPRQPQCITLGRLAPPHLAVRRRPRLSPPRPARWRAAREGCRWRDGWPRPNCDHAPEPCGRAVHCRGRPFRFPHRRRDLRSLRRKSVQAAFRGVLVCQGVRKSSLPGKARGFRGQDTVERHDGLSVAMEKIVQ